MSNLENLRASLRDKEIRISGALCKEDRAREKQVEKVSNETGLRIDKVLGLSFFGKFFEELYKKLARAAIRYEGFVDFGFKLSESDLLAFEEEIYEVINLFEKNGITLTPKTLINVLIYHGLDYWKTFFDKNECDLSRWMIVHTIEKSPCDTIGRISEIEETIKEILEDPEFSAFKDGDLKWIINREVVTNNDPKSSLRKIKATIEELLAEEEFEIFKDLRGPVNVAVTYHKKDPGKFLRKIISNSESLKVNPEFEEFRHCPWIFLQATTYNPNNPIEYLRRVKKIRKEMLKVDEIKRFYSNNPSGLLRIIISNLSDPLPTLREKLKQQTSHSTPSN